MDNIVALAPVEMWHARRCAEMVIENGLRFNCRDFTDGDKLQNHCVGLAAQLCYSRWIEFTRFDLLQSAEMGNRKDGDVCDFEVRSTEKDRYGLSVNPRDNLDRVFVFVPRVSQLEWRVWGWTYGHEVVERGRPYASPKTGETIHILGRDKLRPADEAFRLQAMEIGRGWGR